MKKKDNYNYFKQFILITDYIVKSANTLKEIMENFDKNMLDTDITEIHKLENEADHIVHEMREYLIKDFLPPIDREDIVEIVNKLDNIEDGIDEILINTKILGIDEINSDVIELIYILVKCCEAVREIFLDFNNFKKAELIKEKTINVNNLEEQGDRVYESIMSKLYRNETNPIELVKWTNIYKCLEDTIDCCESAADTAYEVVMKNS